MRTGVSLLSFLLLAGGVSSVAQKSSPYALVAGTVFRDTGLALPGAEVTLTAKTMPEGVKKFKPQRAVSDSRGEYAFRVPLARAEYTVSARADGFMSAQKDVTVEGEIRVDVFLELSPKSGAKK